MIEVNSWLGHSPPQPPHLSSLNASTIPGGIAAIFDHEVTSNEEKAKRNQRYEPCLRWGVAPIPPVSRILFA